MEIFWFNFDYDIGIYFLERLLIKKNEINRRFRIFVNVWNIKIMCWYIYMSFFMIYEF